MFFKERYLIYARITLFGVILLCILIYSSGFKIAKHVIIDGTDLGLVLNEIDVYKMKKEIENEINLYQNRVKISQSKRLIENCNNTKEVAESETGDNDFVCDLNPVFLSELTRGKNITDRRELKQRMMSKIDLLVECYSITIDEIPSLGFVSEHAAKQAIDEHKRRMVGEMVSDDAIIEYENNFKIEKRFLPIYMLRDVSYAADFLCQENEVIRKYEKNFGDSIEGLSKRFNISCERIKELNPNGIENATEILVSEMHPNLGIRITKDIEYTEEIPFETEYFNDESTRKGETKLVSKGQNGKNRILAKVVFKNGKQIENSIIGKEKLIASKKEIIFIGTKENSFIATGSFLRPSSGRITSRFGMRWGRPHTGVDIGSYEGSEIVASDSGVVEFAGVKGGYGKFVMINHKNGYKTGYGHNSEILVKVGENVRRGQVISRMGNTGRSTGPHLHFEIIKNGEYLDPLKFVEMKN